MIVEKLRESRESLDIKQKDIAELFKVHFTTVSGWENGNDTIPLARLIIYANHFNFSLDYLYGLTKHNLLYDKIVFNLDNISKNLKALRKANNITQRELCKRLNIADSTYSDYENGKRLISTTTLYALTTIYKPFSIDAIFDRKRLK